MTALLPIGLPGPVRRRTVVGTPRADGAAVHLAVAEIGPTTSRAVVLGHGVGSSARFVAAACAPALLGAGFRLVVFDQRGHGGSTACPDRGDHGLDAYTRDLEQVAATTGGQIAAAGGISLGGHAGIRARLPVARVACLPAWSGPSTPGVGPHAAVAAEVRAVGSSAVTDRLRADRMLPAWLRRTLVTDYQRHDPASLTAALLALDGADAPTDEEVADLTEPLAVLGWPDDPGHPLAVAERWAATARRGTLTIMDLSEPDEAGFGVAVVRALASVDVTAGPLA